MKKGLLAIAGALLMGGYVAVAQETTETVAVVEEQEYLINGFANNWFITLEGGADVFMSPNDSHMKLGDRIQPAGSFYVGKWFTPVAGARIGVDMQFNKGLSSATDAMGLLPDQPLIDGFMQQKFLHIGPTADIMLNLTNWWCGYTGKRVYNAIFYAGAGAYWTMTRHYNGTDYDPYRDGKDNILQIHAGLINQFRVSKAFNIFLDLRATGIDNNRDETGYAWHKTALSLSAYLGVTYLFPPYFKWEPARTTTTIVEVNNCDEYVARLEAADARIADLEAQLQACLTRPVEKEIVEVKKPEGPLATIYFPIRGTSLTPEDVMVISAVAEVMKSNPDTRYVVTGWADTYTGTPAINARLREGRADVVARQLVRAGVPESQIERAIGEGNLVDCGEKFVALDRAATITIAE